MAAALGLKKLADFMTKSVNLEDPVVILALRYPPQDEEDADSPGRQPHSQEDLVSDLSSKLWFSYRTGFEQLGLDKLTSDVGWGCTLRSCQMMLAQALVMHFLGRLTSLPDKWKPTLTFILSLLYDSPAAAHPFSIHSICAAGAPYGLVPGKWMGPYAICRAFQDLGTAHLSSFLRIVTVDSGGGVPCLDYARLAEHFQPRERAAHEGLYMWRPDQAERTTGLLILLPVVLGVDRLNEVYAEQLQAVLRLPQSVGIVGGKPGHSLYFIGYQDQKLLYLDPHDVQPTEASPSLSTHSSDAVLTVPMTAIDSTMALGFYCHSAEELKDLCEQISIMQEKYRRAPLMCVGPSAQLQLSCAGFSEPEDDAFGLSDESLTSGKPAAAEDSGARPSTDRLGSDEWEMVG